MMIETVRLQAAPTPIWRHVHTGDDRGRAAASRTDDDVDYTGEHAMGQSMPPQPVVVVLSEDNTITLPDEVARQFHPTDRFALLQQGDTLILKRVSAPRVSDIVAATPDEAPLDLDEINDIVHELRSQRRAQP